MLHFERWKIAVILAILLVGFGLAVPNVLRQDTLEALPSWLPNQTVNLGLDLRGGSYLLVEVEVDAVVREQLDALVDGIRIELRQAGIGYTGLGLEGGRAVVTIRDRSQVQAALDAVREIDPTLEVEELDGRLSIGVSEQTLDERRKSAVDQSIEIVRRRIDETGVREPTIQRQGDDRILIQLPGIDDPERMKDLLGTTAKMTFHLVDSRVVPGVDPVPAGSRTLPSDSEVDSQGNPRTYVVGKRVVVSGDLLVDAQPTFQDNQPVVSFRFDSVGARKFGDATRDNVGQQLAIVLDNKVISAPTIREPITGGSGVISGSFTVQSASDLALLLRAGALPAPLTILEERTVGPGLGADSIRAGEIASVIGLIFVAGFMVVIYGLFGLAANVALLANIVLILGALSGLQATLTLPGIAGIVLTIGMAVDANVLIFERIREESQRGRGPVTATDAGFRRALITIWDSNLTTLIAGILLFQFGSGPVKGFAVTLSIGIITSMFTAIMVTRLLLVMWLRRWRPSVLPI
jgi:preprotein translocase subunit SecD